MRDNLESARRTRWRAIDAAVSMQSSELWSWRFDGEYRVTPFGAVAADVTESNAAQLWNSGYLAIHPPADPRWPQAIAHRVNGGDPAPLSAGGVPGPPPADTRHC